MIVLFMAMMFTFPIAFNYGDIAGKTVVVAASVFTILQVVKKYTNWSFLQGKWAIAANILFNIVGVVAVTSANQLFTMNTLVQLLTGILVASGFHGITTTLVPSIGGAGDPDNPTNRQVLTEDKPPVDPQPPVEPPSAPHV